MARRLFVFLHGRRVGVLTSSGPGVEFRYDHDVSLDSTLSMSLPAEPRRRFSAQKASAYFDGLLPDGTEARLRMARSLGSHNTSTFSLLSRAGLDCAGAVQFHDEEALPASHGELIPITDKEVGQRLLNSLNASHSAPQRVTDERWSVSGAQGKIALRLEGGEWYVATGSEPHSHILKPGISLRGDIEPGQQALVEHITMKAAASLGVDTANTSYQEFNGVPCVVVERFDRERDAQGSLARIHQEDMCQALGISPSSKYEDDGGPTATQMAQLLNASAGYTPQESEQEVLALADMIAFNYLSGSPDAHGKNYALLRSKSGDVRLAPMYDAASGNVSSREDMSRRFNSAAMSIGAENRFGRASLQDWKVFSSDMLGRRNNHQDFIARYVDMSQAMPDAFSDAIASSDAPKEARRWLEKSPLLRRLAEDGKAFRDSVRREGGSKITPTGRTLPGDRATSDVCGQIMPRAGVPCGLPRGHAGWPHKGHARR